MRGNPLLKFRFDWGWAKGIGLGLTLERYGTTVSFNLIFLCWWLEVTW